MNMTLSELFSDYWQVFFVAMLPIAELRVAIPLGLAMGLPMLPTFIVAVLGNVLPVPFLILFSQQLLRWLAKFRKIGPFFQKIIDKAERKAASFGRYELLALFAFVAIPLPGTGAWTGSLIAAILQLDWKKALPAIFLGIIGAGVIMSLATAGVFGAFGKLFQFSA